MRKLLSLLGLAAAGCASVQPLEPTGVIPLTVRAVELDSTHPGRSILGRLRYLGGVELSSPDKRLGGISSLKWRGGNLHAVTDVGDWLTLRTSERNGVLFGAAVTAIGDLLGPDGAKLEGSATGDSEALAHDGRGWLVAFEHQHKILRYERLGGRVSASGLDPLTIFGALQENQGVETLAARRGRLFVCAERLSSAEAPHCFIKSRNAMEAVHLPPPQGLDPRTAFPVDADWGEDGTLYILMRSWSGGSDNRAAIVSRSPSGDLRLLAAFTRPVVTDNFEGLAVREERGRTFLYLASDDNFRVYDDPTKPETWQHTYLMKFELLG